MRAVDMHLLQELVRLHRLGLSNRVIAKRLGSSRTAERKYRTPLSAAGILEGEAGLRSGEIRALEWSSIDFRRRMLTVERSEYKGHVTLPKHDKIRTVSMTARLTQALLEHRHLQGPRVLYRDDMEAFTVHTLADWLWDACK